MPTPISATGNSTDHDSRAVSRHRFVGARGFSLLELLVVITIIGIFTGVAVLSVGVLGDDRNEQREAQRLKSLLQLIHEQAVMQSRDYGVLFSQSGYRFYVYDSQQLKWIIPTQNRLLRQHVLRSPLNLSLTMEGRPVAFAPAKAAAVNTTDQPGPETAKEPHPQVIILSSGQITPFKVAIYRDAAGSRFTVSAKINGVLAIKQTGLNENG